MSKRIEMSSKVGSMVCPACGAGELRRDEGGVARCEGCEGTVGWEMLEALAQIAALPEALGSHPCECGHPEMRHLPDGSSHCPSCGSDILPLGHPRMACGDTSEAYLRGWEDGLFGQTQSFARNARLGRFGDADRRLDYYRGHRDGRWVREMAAHGGQTA
jgi:uncharacterized Zn finger protein (UPF0148 family)